MSYLLHSKLVLMPNLVQFVIESNELSEYSYISLGDFLVFFKVKNLKTCARSILIFRSLILISF